MAKTQAQKQITKAYKINLHQIQKDFFNKSDTGLILFVEYLKYLRDNLILINQTGFDSNPNKDLKIATITAAIAEYEAYYNLEIFNNNSQLKTLHWNTFWELVKTNLNDWMLANDTV